ncbi:MAG: hypothetical protein ACODAG_00235 [Myxococcota bacterium]
MNRSRAVRASVPLWLAALLWMAFGPDPAAAQVGLRVHQAPDAVRVDGMLREWGGVPKKRIGTGADASMRYAIAHDDRGLYVAASVADDRVVRSSSPGRKEDAIVLTLALPTRRGLRGVELWLYPGVAGRARAAAGRSAIGGRPRPLPGAKVVEGPRRRGPGYDLEAFIPWKAIPGSSRWQRGHAAIRLRDVDREARPKVEAEPASAKVDSRALDRLPSLIVAGSSSELLERFLAHKNLAGLRPRADLSGNVAGDRRKERIVLVDKYALVMGPGFRKGESYDYLKLPVRSAADVRKARLRDLTGDGHDELLLLLRQGNDRGSRHLWMVFVVGDDGIAPEWGVEVRKKTGDGVVEARFDIQGRRRGPPVLRLRAGKARGLSAENYREAPARDVAPIPLPWGKVLERRYQYRDGRFTKVGEKENPDYEPPRPKRTERRSRPAPQRRAAPAAAPSIDQLIAAVKKKLGVPSGASGRFEHTENLAEDGRDERLVVFGKTLVVVGPGFRGGEGYFVQELPVADAKDVLRVKPVDLTGDGRREVLMRIRQRFEEGVTREVLMAYCFHDGGFHRILAVEVARQQNGREVRNGVRLARDGKRYDIVVTPGRAEGWDASSWSFRDGEGDDGVEPLLLPWRDRPVRYGYVGEGIGRK